MLSGLEISLPALACNNASQGNITVKTLKAYLPCNCKMDRQQSKSF